MLLTDKKTQALIAMIERCQCVLEVELLDDLIRRELNIPLHPSNFDIIEHYCHGNDSLEQIQRAVADKLLDLQNW